MAQRNSGKSSGEDAAKRRNDRGAVSGGTDPAGRPQPGAGNAGDGDRPRKNPAGLQLVRRDPGDLGTGKREATAKTSTAPGRKETRSERGQAAEGSRAGHKEKRLKKGDGRGRKRRAA
jgi:hypothetical protein